MHGDAADTMGTGGIWFDPLWRVEVVLTPLERHLLTTWPVRRLAFVSHAGAASITTTQGYSRLEHSLGVLALVAHFAPDDALARVTALLHDVGHLPFSHTLERVGGRTELDHHVLGRAVVRALGPDLRAGGIDPEDVIATDEGALPSPLSSRPGGLKVDHLDSFLRSGQANGRTRTSPAVFLRRLRLADGTVDADPDTAAELVDLIVREARAQRSAANLAPNAVLRDLVARLLDDGTLTVHRLTGATDADLWAVLLAAPATAADADRLRRHPEQWRMRIGAGPGLQHVVRRSYLDLPTVDGATVTDRRVADLLADLPFAVAVDRTGADRDRASGAGGIMGPWQGDGTTG